MSLQNIYLVSLRCYDLDGGKYRYDGGVVPLRAFQREEAAQCWIVLQQAEIVVKAELVPRNVFHLYTRSAHPQPERGWDDLLTWPLGVWRDWIEDLPVQPKPIFRRTPLEDLSDWWGEVFDRRTHQEVLLAIAWTFRLDILEIQEIQLNLKEEQ